MPAGAVADWASRPSRRATSFVEYDEISAPSRCTAPAFGRSRRTSARSSVDLPQAFGPTMTVNAPSGMSIPSSRATTRWS